MIEDTIAAISTPIGEGGIAIIRLSGPSALRIADSLFNTSRGKPSEFSSHTIHFGTMGANGDLIDQVMLTVMRAPRTYTAEDVVEINCHGGLLTARKILASCLQNGARLAVPGEFTKRAFLNGRIDLTQAEAVMDLISAKSDRAQTAAAHALEGHLAKRIDETRERLVTVLAHIEAHIDFPEEDIAPDSRDKLRADLEAIIEFLENLLATAHEGKILRDGLPVTIIGRPNAGKSSLMNALLGEDRSIVTPIPGTTRDTIEEFANIRGIPVRFTDTAGIRKPRGKVEGIGVKRSRKALDSCALVLHILDGSRPFAEADSDLAKLYGRKPVIHVRTKVDLLQRLNLPQKFASAIGVSARTGAGLEDLKSALEERVWSGRTLSGTFDIVVNERHADALRRALNSLMESLALMKRSAEMELISQHLRIGLNAVGEIVGKTSTDDILDKVFSSFCIGK